MGFSGEGVGQDVILLLREAFTRNVCFTLTYYLLYLIFVQDVNVDVAALASDAICTQHALSYTEPICFIGLFFSWADIAASYMVWYPAYG